MNRIFLSLLMILILASPSNAETINTWLGTGLAPLTTSQYPERDTAGANWRTLSSSSPLYGTYNMIAASCGGKVYMFSGNNVWSTVDGITVTQKTSTCPMSFNDARRVGVFNNKLWGVNGKTVYYSSDGATWSIATTTAAFSDAVMLCSFGGYLIGAANNSVFRSSDGITWTSLTTSPGWGTVTDGTMCVFNNKLWVHRGFYSLQPILWSSADGITWTQEVTALSANWNYSGIHMFSYNGRLHISGAVTYISSADGKVFTTHTFTTNYPACVHNGHVWAMFGSSATIKRSY